MEKLDLVKLLLSKHAKVINSGSKSNLFELFMHEARYLMEDQEHGLPVIQTYDYDTKKIGNMIYACSVSNAKVHEQRLHKAGHKMSPFQYFKDNLNEKFQSEISRKVFGDFYSAVYRINLTPGKELEIDSRSSDLVDILLEITEYDEVVNLVKLLVVNPSEFFNRMTHQVTDKKLYDNLVKKSKNFLRDIRVSGIDLLIKLEASFQNNSLNYDYALENNKIYYDFISAAGTSNSLNLVIGASMPFIKKIILDDSLADCRFVFTVEQDYQLQILSQRKVPNITFISADELKSYILRNSAAITNLLQFGRTDSTVDCRLTAAILFDAYCQLSNYMVFAKDSLALGFIPFGTDNGWSPIQISLFPAWKSEGLNHSRKMLLHGRRGPEPDYSPIIVSSYSHGHTQASDYLERYYCSFKFEYDELYDAKWDARKEYFNAIRSSEKKSDKQRASAKPVNLTEEIVIYFTETWGSNGFMRVKAYVADETGTRRRIISSTVKSVKKIPWGKTEDWVKETYPYSTKIEKNRTIDIRSEIGDYYRKVLAGKDISVGTYLYFHKDLDSYFSEPNVKEMMASTGLNEVMVSRISENLLQNTIESIEQKYTDSKKTFLLLTAVSKMLDIAIKEEYATENAARGLLRKTSNASKAYYEVRDALIKRHLDREQMQKLLKMAERKYKNGDKKGLAAMIKLLTGLETSVVSSLTWKDFQEVTGFGKPFYQLIVRRKSTFDGSKVEVLGKKEAYRKIPCPDLLAEVLLREKEGRASTEAIISGGEHVIDTELSIYSPAQLNYAFRAMLKRILDRKELITLPKNEGEVIEIDLNSYLGDIFRSNYRHYVLSDNCKFEKSEADFLLGNTPDTTFARNYCDFNNDAAQLILKKKQDRFASLLTSQPNPIATRKIVDSGAVKVETDPANRTTLTIEVRGNARVEINNNHGFDFDIVSIAGGNNE